MLIRKVDQQDLTELQGIAKGTFLETYAIHNTKSDMEKYLTDHFNLDRVKSELENANSQFFFAQLNSEVTGYVKLNTGQSQTETKLNQSLEIERIYVKTKYQGRGMGVALLDKTIEVAKSEDLERVWLGVWEKNPKAITFYKKYGFVEFDKHVFKLGNDLQTDLMMKLELSA